MMYSVLQADYEQIAAIAQAFGTETAAIAALAQALQKDYLPLEQGDWQGDAGQAFCAEMRASIFPALQRLQAALEHGQHTTRAAADLLAAAEREAAALFHGSSADPGHRSAGGDSGGRKRLAQRNPSTDKRFLRPGDNGEDGEPVSPDTVPPWQTEEYRYTPQEIDALPAYDAATAAAERAALQERAAAEAGTYSIMGTAPIPGSTANGLQPLPFQFSNLLTLYQNIPTNQLETQSALVATGISDLVGLLNWPGGDTAGYIAGSLLDQFGATALAMHNAEIDVQQFHYLIDLAHNGEPLPLNPDYVQERVSDPVVQTEVTAILQNSINQLAVANPDGSTSLYFTVAPDGSLSYTIEQTWGDNTVTRTEMPVSAATFNILAPVFGVHVSNDYANYLDQSELYVHQAQQFVETADRRFVALQAALDNNDEAALAEYRSRIPDEVPPLVYTSDNDQMMYDIMNHSPEQYYALGLSDYVNIIPPTLPVNPES